MRKKVTIENPKDEFINPTNITTQRKPIIIEEDPANKVEQIAKIEPSNIVNDQIKSSLPPKIYCADTSVNKNSQNNSLITETKIMSNTSSSNNVHKNETVNVKSTVSISVKNQVLNDIVKIPDNIQSQNSMKSFEKNKETHIPKVQENIVKKNLDVKIKEDISSSKSQVVNSKKKTIVKAAEVSITKNTVKTSTKQISREDVKPIIIEGSSVQHVPQNNKQDKVDNQINDRHNYHDHTINRERNYGNHEIKEKHKSSRNNNSSHPAAHPSSNKPISTHSTSHQSQQVKPANVWVSKGSNDRPTVAEIVKGTATSSVNTAEIAASKKYNKSELDEC